MKSHFVEMPLQIPIRILFFILNHTNHMLWINVKLIMILISNNVASSTKLLYWPCIYLLCTDVLQDSYLTCSNFIIRHCSTLWQCMYEKHGYVFSYGKLA